LVVDTVGTTSERALATETLRRLSSLATILVGGLGLGLTARTRV
jgi:hypothetical protein